MSWSTDSVAVIDITDVDAASVAMRKAFSNSGFFYVTNHGIDENLIDNLRRVQREFFACSLEVKQEVAIDENNRGYLGHGEAQMHGAKRKDEKEVFFWGSDYGPDDPDRQLGIPMVGDNQWPTAPAEFAEIVKRYSAEISRLGDQVLRCIALSLGAPKDAFVPYYERAMTRGQLICYPPTSDLADAFGVAPHTDFGCITLLLQETAGLQALIGDEWQDVPPLPGTLVVNVGDLLERWTGGQVPSTQHRVVNRNTGARYSIAMFHDPSPQAVVDPNLFENCAARALGYKPGQLQPPTHGAFEPIAAAEYILSRNRGAFAHYQKS